MENTRILKLKGDKRLRDRLYRVQEYTSPIDGKVRFRVISLEEVEAFGDGPRLWHIHGPPEGESYENARRRADVCRLERRIEQSQWR